MRFLLVSAFVVATLSGASAQAVIDLGRSGDATRTAPPSVDDGRANGIRKAAGAPSVGDGRANGVVKPAGAPSVGDGVSNGVMKSTTADR